MKPLYAIGVALSFCFNGLIAQLSDPQLISQQFGNAHSFSLIQYDADGLKDVITKNGSISFQGEETSSEYVLLHNQGSGQFVEEQLFNFEQSFSEAWGDLNGDGWIDFVYSDLLNAGGYQEFYIKWGEGNYNFSDDVFVFSTELLTDPYEALTYDFVAGDVNGDGQEELVFGLNYDISDPTISYPHVCFFYSVSWNGIAFENPVFLASFSNQTLMYLTLNRLFIDDFTADGVNDLIAFSQSDFGADIYVFPGNGIGSFENEALIYPGGWDSFDYAEMDGDSENELVTSFAGYHARFNIQGEDYYEQIVGDVPAPNLTIIDVNGDGWKDVVNGVGYENFSGEDGVLEIAMNTGVAATPWDVVNYNSLAGNYIAQLDAADIDNDEIDELVVASGGQIFLLYVNTFESVTAGFNANTTVACNAQEVSFFDMSEGEVINWSWTFEGGDPSSASTPDPVITYSIPGTYAVSLVVSSVDDSASITLLNYITVIPTETLYADLDADSYGDPASMIISCIPIDGYVMNSDDCDDNSFAVNPTSVEVCNELDDNCDGAVDEGVAVIYFADEDGDGFGNPALNLAACALPVGYTLNSQDCNDGNAQVFPGATEICNGINDDCDGSIDEGCAPAPANDHPLGAITLAVNASNTTSVVTGNLAAATVSPESLIPAATGQDLWYKFTATEPGIRLRVTSSNVNILIELQRMDGTLVDYENLNPAAGNEFLNFGSLTVGDQYRVAVRNFNSAQGTGTFNISANYLRDSYCTNTSTSFQYCNLINALPVNAAAYAFTLTSLTTDIGYSVTQNYYTYARLSSIPGLLAGDDYTLAVHAIYYVSNGLGIMEVIPVINIINCEIQILPWTQVYLASTNSCPAVVTSTSVVNLNVAVCRAIDYQWEFTPVSPAGTIITQMRGSHLANFPLTTVPVVTGTTYNVRVRPKFSNGMFGDWGPSNCMQVGILQMNMANQPVLDDMVVRNDLNIYPNPVIDGHFVVDFKSTERRNLELRIRDISGKLVQEETNRIVESHIYECRLNEGLHSGIYFVEIKTNGAVEFHNLIIR